MGKDEATIDWHPKELHETQTYTIKNTNYCQIDVGRMEIRKRRRKGVIDTEIDETLRHQNIVGIQHKWVKNKIYKCIINKISEFSKSHVANQHYELSSSVFEREPPISHRNRNPHSRE